MLKTIVVAIDESDAAAQACDLAMHIAQAEHAGIVLVNVLDISRIVVAGASGAPYPDDSVEIMQDTYREIVSAVKDKCEAAGLHVETEMVEGDPCNEILRVAKEHNADLICIGTHGRKGLSRLFLGSVAEGVLRSSPCPVLTTRPAGHRAPIDPERGSSHVSSPLRQSVRG
jgi:nucleotide-binding universal stress UspA family protein